MSMNSDNENFEDSPEEELSDEESLEEEFAAYLNDSMSETNTNEDFVFNKTRQEYEGTFEDISEEMIKKED